MTKIDDMINEICEILELKYIPLFLEFFIENYFTRDAASRL